VLRAVLRVAQEIAADLAARKIGWVALAIALVVLGLFFWVLRHDIVSGAAAAVRSFGGPGGVADADTLARWVGRYTASWVYWALLPGSAIFAAMFAPPFLDPRRTILLYAQPVSRGDVAGALYAAVCAIVLCEYAFLVALLYAGIRWLGVAVSPRFLLMVAPLLVAFAALYAAALATTYAIRSGVAAGGAGFLLFIVSAIVGWRTPPGFTPRAIGAVVLPRVAGLAEQAGRLGSGEWPRAAPFALTAAVAASLFLVALFAARRSEQ
jgi:hypothetical protein